MLLVATRGKKISHLSPFLKLFYKKKQRVTQKNHLNCIIIKHLDSHRKFGKIMLPTGPFLLLQSGPARRPLLVQVQWQASDSPFHWKQSMNKICEITAVKTLGIWQGGQATWWAVGQDALQSLAETYGRPELREKEELSIQGGKRWPEFAG